MSTSRRPQMKTAETPVFSQVPVRLIQRACACGQHTIGGSPCAACAKKEETLQRHAAHESAHEKPAVPESIHQVLGSAGQSLDAATRSFMESRFGHDFSHVRVHTDAQAAESARAVNALAYTFGRDVVFGAGQYAPHSTSGKRLLSHELTHVLQQRSGLEQAHRPASEETSADMPQTKSTAQTKLQIGAQEDRYEREADRVAKDVMERGGDARAAVHATTNAPASIQLQPATPKPKVVPPVAPNKDQQKIIDTARKAAHLRASVALGKLRGTTSPGPYGSVDSVEMRLEAQMLAQRMFQVTNVNMTQVEQVVSKMVTHLASAPVMIAGPNDPECSFSAYVGGSQPPIILCPGFFKDPKDAEGRIRTMTHETAHLAGIRGKPGSTEGYCALFDCNAFCGSGFQAADSWSHFVYCLSGQPPDPAAVQTKPGGGTKKPGGGTKP